MKRREFLGALGGAAAAWPIAAVAQRERERRIGILVATSPNDTEFQGWIGVLLQTLALWGWIIGQNIRVEIRWAGGNASDIRRHAAELVALSPDLIVAHGGATVGALLQATRTVPVVFPVADDPVGAGFVESLARPATNATGFMNMEFSTAGKWLELLKEVAPHVTRVGVLRDSSQGTGTSQFAAVQTAAPSLRVVVTPINTRDTGEIERGVAAFARSPDGGLVVASGRICGFATGS